MSKTVLSVIGFSQQLAQSKQRSPSSRSVWTSLFKYIIHKQRTQVMEIFKGLWANTLFESVIYG